MVFIQPKDERMTILSEETFLIAVQVSTHNAGEVERTLLMFSSDNAKLKNHIVSVAMPYSLLLMLILQHYLITNIFRFGGC